MHLRIVIFPSEKLASFQAHVYITYICREPNIFRIKKDNLILELYVKLI